MSSTPASPDGKSVTPTASTTPAPSKPSSSTWRWISVTVPNLIVFGLLGGVFYLGDHTGWKMPKLSELRGATAAAPDDWCTEHLVPESICVECNPKLMPKPKESGFCRKHGVAECVTCHPELAQVAGEPRLPSYDTVRAISVMARPENNSKNTLYKSRVQFASMDSVNKSGLDIDVVEERRMTDAIVANGEIVFDPSRVAHLSPRAAGTVFKVFKTTGDSVETDDILALIDASLVGQAKSQLLQAVVQVQLKRSNLERLKAAGAGVPAKSLIEAEAVMQEAEITLVSGRQSLVNLGFDVPDQLENRDAKELAVELQLLGIPESIVGSLGKTTKTTNLIPVRAPESGVVVSSDIVVGEVVDATDLLYTIADPKRMWLTLNVRQEDAKYVKTGLTVEFQPEEGSDAVAGRVSWISPAIDERTRTLQVRVTLDEGAASLRDKTFGTGRIVLRDEPKAIVVPREAVQSTSDAKFVFVRDRNFFKEGSPKVFHVRQVRIGAQDDKSVELLAGALPGEVIVTKGSAMLLAQLLRSNLGAGCGCHEH